MDGSVALRVWITDAASKDETRDQPKSDDNRVKQKFRSDQPRQIQDTVPFRSIQPSPVLSSGGLDEIGSLSPVPHPCGRHQNVV